MIFYLCNGKACKNCRGHNPDCRHTMKVEHAVNFKRVGNDFWEELDKEDKLKNGTLIDIETVAKLMVEMFDDCPCNYNDIDEYMCEHCGDWCDKSCVSVSATGDYTPCWVKYLTAKLEELKRGQK